MDYAALSALLEQLDSRHEAEERRREERFADTAKMTAETVLYGPAGGIATSTAKCVWHVNVVKQILWEGRNVCVYHKQELNTITTTRRAQTLIKDFVILDIRTLGKEKACADWRIVGLQDVKME
ncbi:UNVERIFIED_CONTAM: hypothetical protein FKN15_014877 [Acipenser sinensis]